MPLLISRTRYTMEDENIEKKKVLKCQDVFFFLSYFNTLNLYPETEKGRGRQEIKKMATEML